MIADNVFVRMFVLDHAGDVHDGHAHSFDHLTLLASGTIEFRTQKTIEPPKVEYFTAPAIIVTPKGIVHEIEAKSDNCVLACIHAIRNGDGLDDIAPQEITPEEARALIEKYPLVESIKSIFGN